MAAIVLWNPGFVLPVRLIGRVDRKSWANPLEETWTEHDVTPVASGTMGLRKSWILAARRHAICLNYSK
jgi:hypothetical protein